VLHAVVAARYSGDWSRVQNIIIFENVLSGSFIYPFLVNLAQFSFDHIRRCWMWDIVTAWLVECMESYIRWLYNMVLWFFGQHYRPLWVCKVTDSTNYRSTSDVSDWSVHVLNRTAEPDEIFNVCPTTSESSSRELINAMDGGRALPTDRNID